MKKVAVIGSTGSVGRQTLDVIENTKGEYEVFALVANKNLELLTAQVNEWSPVLYSCNSNATPRRIGKSHATTIEAVVSCDEIDVFIFASAGYANLNILFTALRLGKTIALANKELMVMAGSQIMKEARRHKTKLLPLDSEPVGILQCLTGETEAPARAILTASGGAFYGRNWEDLVSVTPEEALRHPTWSMGSKITIDSATLVNKAFEVAELHWFFGIPFSQIEVVLHPQSYVHSLLIFKDGSCKAQLGPPDMRYSVSYVMSYPHRIKSGTLEVDWDVTKIPDLTFERLKPATYPGFELALSYIKRGGTAPALLVGANQAAIELFLDKKIKFTEIPSVIANTLRDQKTKATPTIDEIIEATNRSYKMAIATGI